MTSFADSWQYQELLAISKDHLDSLDHTRVRSDTVIGNDNLAKLKVSTVFAAISLEAALNNFILVHCLHIENAYLQGMFGKITKQYLLCSVHEKISLIRQCWPEVFPDSLVADVKEMFRIRNRVTHESDEIVANADSKGGGPVVKNRPLTNDQMQHMRRHYDISRDFLSRFWFPGDRELNQRCEESEPFASE